MAGINKTILLGNLGQEPEQKTLESGLKLSKFSLAVGESFKDKDGNWQESTTWLNIVLWGYNAEKNLKKGDKIYLEGKIKTRSWEDQNGQKKYITEIHGDKVLKLNTSATANHQDESESYANRDNHQPEQYENGNDMPF